MIKNFVKPQTRNILVLLLLLLSGSLAFPAELLSAKGNRYITSFGQAKKILLRLNSSHAETFYCGCKYYGKEVNMNSCHSYSPGQSPRFKKLEWEHVVPAERFGQSISAWHEGNFLCRRSKKGRKCAEKASPLFRQMEGDLYNLWPESGGINQARSNKPPKESVSGQITRFGECETYVGKKAFVPRPEIRGRIARSYLYMSDTYGIPLSPEEKTQFTIWNELHPVDAWECQRSREIEKIQGNVNSFVREPCEQKGLWLAQ